MRDLDDLGGAFALLERRADAHPLDLIITEERAHPHRGRRTGLAIAAAAAVAAVATGVGFAVSGSSGSSAPQHTSAAPAPAASTTEAGWTQLPTGHYLVILDRLPGAKIRSVIGVGNDNTHIPQFPNDYQEIQVSSDEGSFVFKVNPSTGWAPPTDAQQATVDGRIAYYGEFLLHPEIPNHPVHPRFALAWQYAPGSWATVASWTQDPIPLGIAEHIVSEVTIGVGDELPANPPPGN
jgi:hypothetical protein